MLEWISGIKAVISTVDSHININSFKEVVVK